MPNMLRVRAVATGVAGSPFYFTQYFAADTATPQQVTDAVRTLLTAARPFTRTGLSWQMDSTVQTIDSASGQPVNAVGVTAGAPIVGTSSGDPLPQQVQMGVRLTTGVYANGRAVRGHFSMPGIVETVNVTGTSPNIADTNVVAFQAALDTLVGSATTDWVVWSRTGGSYAVVTAAQVATIWFTLRSRLT